MNGRTVPSWARFLLAAATAVLLLKEPLAAEEPTFRLRSDFLAPLNSDEGWGAGTGEAGTVIADKPFRLRLETTGVVSNGPLALQVRSAGGEWDTLEAHDFPYPERDLTLGFDGNELGRAPQGWKVLRGDAGGLMVIERHTNRMLQFDGLRTGLTASYELPWEPSEDITVAAHLRLLGRQSAVDLLFGLIDDQTFHAVRLHKDGLVHIVRSESGEETILAENRIQISWSEGVDVELSVQHGRLEVEVDGVLILTQDIDVTRGYPGFRVARGDRVQISEVTFEGVARTPPVSIVSTQSYAHGEPTSDLLPGSVEPFTPGMGVSMRDRAKATNGSGVPHSEFEWPLVIRHHADGPTRSDDGDVFEFRMVGAEDENAVSPVARVALLVPPGHLGGTFIETPGRIGPWQASNGDLYFMMEPSETDNVFMMMKSDDGGATWREVDGPNRPNTDDLESVDSRLVGDRIHIIHQVTRSVRYHRFRTSDHPTHPDSWEIRDETAARADAMAQMATMAVRSDGSIACIFLSDRLEYVSRAVDGSWSEPVLLDGHDDVILAGPQAVLGQDDRVHLAYFSDDGIIWYRLIAKDGTLSEPQRLAEGASTGRPSYGSVLPLTYDPNTDVVTVAYRLADGRLWERSLSGSKVPTEPRLISNIPVVTNAVDSQQAGADLIRTDDGLVAIFIDEETRSLNAAREVEGAWSPAWRLIEDINGSWVRGETILRPDGSTEVGYIYDAGSLGGTGLNRFRILN